MSPKGENCCQILIGVAHPRRPKAIQEETVVKYLLDCIRAKYNIDWPAFTEEVNFTSHKAMQIQAAVAKVGQEKLKPIIELLPEEGNQMASASSSSPQSVKDLASIGPCDDDDVKGALYSRVSSGTDPHRCFLPWHNPPALCVTTCFGRDLQAQCAWRLSL
eukprot:SM000103S09520  [mRNA]  locus=s103:503361:506853:+ [translate_table: standard]